MNPPLVKICGLRSPERALAAVGAGADLLGFNFAPVSRRRIDLETARAAVDVCRAAARSAPIMVGIFVNQPVAEIAATVRRCQLDYVQLSGDESPDECRQVATATGAPIIKAVRFSEPEAGVAIEAYAGDGGVAILLADAPVAGSWGGSGAAWDWSTAASLAARFPLLLAGGLTPATVADAVRAVRPWGVDVASGVETGGQTDPARVRAFVEQAKGALLTPQTTDHLQHRGGTVSV